MKDIDPRRRALLLAASLLPLALAMPHAARADALPTHRRFTDRLRALERSAGGRLGVAAMAVGGNAIAYRGDERFLMCSTFKVALAANVLKRIDDGVEQLQRPRLVAPEALVSWSPITEKHAGKTMTVAELCAATVTVSDNTAANLLLPAIGGPPGIGAFTRTLGDTQTRLDRTETELNSAIADDPRDTTTPLAMLGNLRALLLDEALGPASHELLEGWLRGNKTGDARLRAGLPKDWRAGDKTGTGDRGTYNDVAIFWPPRRGPVMVTSYLSETKLGTDAGNAVHAQVARALVGVI